MKCWDGSTCLKDCLQSCKPWGVAIVPPNDGTVTVMPMGDVHAHRPAICADCVVGTCSINNCLYPTCSRAFIDERNRIHREDHEFIRAHTIDDVWKP